MGRSAPFTLGALHQPGSAATGEGRGIFDGAPTAGMIFLDGGMSPAEPATYELLDLTTGLPAARVLR